MHELINSIAKAIDEDIGLLGCDLQSITANNVTLETMKAAIAPHNPKSRLLEIRLDLQFNGVTVRAEDTVPVGKLRLHYINQQSEIDAVKLSAYNICGAYIGASAKPSARFNLNFQPTGETMQNEQTKEETTTQTTVEQQRPATPGEALDNAVATTPSAGEASTANQQSAAPVTQQTTTTETHKAETK